MARSCLSAAFSFLMLHILMKLAYLYHADCEFTTGHVRHARRQTASQHETSSPLSRSVGSALRVFIMPSEEHLPHMFAGDDAPTQK